MCEVDGCTRRRYARGLCGRHHKQWQRHGLVQAERTPDACAVEGCASGGRSVGYCRSHYARLLKHGDPLAGGPLRTARPDGHLSHGYRKVRVPPAERWLVAGAAVALEHRLVMARALGRCLFPDESVHHRIGRCLFPDESVHHRNGDRLDNRSDNLELWTRYRPAGSRVEDKPAWAYEILRRYDVAACAALGLDPVDTANVGTVGH
jgi:hypothetical protein